MKFTEWLNNRNQSNEAHQPEQKLDTFRQRQQASLAQEKASEPKPEQMTSKQQERAVDSVRNVAGIVKDAEQQNASPAKAIEPTSDSTHAAERSLQGPSAKHSPALSPTDGGVARNYLEKDSQSQSTSRSNDHDQGVSSPSPTPTPNPPNRGPGIER